MKYDTIQNQLGRPLHYLTIHLSLRNIDEPSF